MKFRGKIWNWRTFGAVFCFYTILSLFFLPRIFFGQDMLSELKMILFFSLGNYLWVILTLVVFQLGENFPVIYPLNPKNLALHFLFSLAVAAFFTPFYVALVNLYNYGVVSLTASELPAFFIINTVTNSFMYYTGSLAAHQAVFYSNKFRERESQLQQAELQILKMQLHPHFFFNTLNAISALMYRSPKQADRMIVQLGDMFRIALRKDKAQEISLKEELDFLQSFLQIHQTLMGKRLQAEWEIEPETLDAQVPNLILQPLAENAIQHGIAPIEAGGQITIFAAKQNGNLILQVSDDGIGFDPAIKRLGDGIGLSNTRARLESLYGEKQKFSIDESPAGGISVKIEIPFREQTKN
jgi:two-component system, LytTR family, sensor kinase